jgi:acyl dehydratase
MTGDFVNTFQGGRLLRNSTSSWRKVLDHHNAAFSRAQANAKFTHWKAAFVSQRATLIEEDNVESIEKS